MPARSYGQARALLDAYTAVGGVPGTGWDLHEYLILVSPTSARPGPACPC